jgi:hypothetical protein
LHILTFFTERFCPHFFRRKKVCLFTAENAEKGRRVNQMNPRTPYFLEYQGCQMFADSSIFRMLLSRHPNDRGVTH